MCVCVCVCVFCFLGNKSVEESIYMSNTQKWAVQHFTKCKTDEFQLMMQMLHKFMYMLYHWKQIRIANAFTIHFHLYTTYLCIYFPWIIIPCKLNKLTTLYINLLHTTSVTAEFILIFKKKYEEMNPVILTEPCPCDFEGQIPKHWHQLWTFQGISYHIKF